MKYYFLSLAILCLLLTSCNKNESRGVEYVPFQETEDGQWSMISPSGEVLFTEEFKNAPTVAKEGRFMVKNESGLWEIFTTDAKPQKIGNEYAYASCFSDGKAFVSERNDYIKIIDKDGNELKKLDKIGNRIIDAISDINEGYAVYQTGDYFGAINSSGEEVVKSDYVRLWGYSDGKFIGIHKKFEKELEKKEDERKINYDVLDEDGKKLFEIKSEKYSDIGTRFIDGLLPVSVKKDGKNCWGLINDKNEVVIKPAEKIKGISDIKDKKFIYNNGEGYGVMNLEGENIVRAKYDLLYFDVSGRLVAISEKTKGSFNYECKFIDDEDNQIGEDRFVSINPYYQFDGKHSFVKISDRIWSIVDKDGKQLEKLPDIVNINLSFGDTEIINDHVDFANLFADMKIGVNTLDEFTMETSPKEAVDICIKNDGLSGTDKHPANDPYWFDYKRSVDYIKNFSKVPALIQISYPSYMSRQTYRTEYRSYYGYSFSHQVPSGYAFNDVKPSSFAVIFLNKGKMAGKLELLLKEIKAHFKKDGKVEKENDGAAVYTINEKCRAMVCMDEKSVLAIWGDIKEVKELDIEKYMGKKEKIQIDRSVIQTVNGNGSPIQLAPLAADSLEEVVDSVVAE